MRTLTISLLFLVPVLLCASAQPNSGGLAKRVAELEAQLEELSAILEFVYVETGSINGLGGPHLIFEGVNVHVRSGSGNTYPRICVPGHPNCLIGAGLGNLVVGYNEMPPSPTPSRRGMHNLVVGPEHHYTGDGGFVAGNRNVLRGRGASVTGGQDNQAIGGFSSVSGGSGNVASGGGASVSGGSGNVASGLAASVSGGENREAPGEFNWTAGALFEAN